MSGKGPTFAELVDGAANTHNLNDYQLSAAIGLMPGNRVCSPKQVRRIRNGEQANYHRDLVARLIVVLELDPAEAWEAAGVWPPGLTAEQVRRLGLFRGTGRDRREDRQIDTDAAATGAVADLRGSTMGTWTLTAGDRAGVVAA